MLIIAVILGILFLFFAIFYITQFFDIIFRGCAPYISTDKSTLNNIISEIEIVGDEKVYELGCGNAGFLKNLSAKHKNIELIGVEHSFWPWLINALKYKLLGLKNIKIIRNNFFNIDLSDASVIYCYLNIRTMQALGQKFLKECRPGTRIISYRFKIKNLNPEKTLLNGSDKIYMYKI